MMRSAWRRYRRVAGRAAVIVVMLGGVTTAASAQPPAPRPGREGRAAAPDVLALQDLFDSYVLVQAQQQLALAPDRAPQFILRLRELLNLRRRQVNQKRRVLLALRTASTAPNRNRRADEDEVRRQLRDLDALDMRSATELRQAMANLDQVLDVYQQARFRVLEEQLERRKLEILMQARRGAKADPF